MSRWFWLAMGLVITALGILYATGLTQPSNATVASLVCFAWAQTLFGRGDAR